MKTHWKKWSNTKFLGSWDFEPGEDKTVIIDRVEHEAVTSPDGTVEMKRVMYFDESEDLKPFIVNETNANAISDVLGSEYMEDWSGKGIILTVQKVPAFGKLTDAVRVRPVKPHECEECGKPIKGNSDETPLEIKKRTQKKYGKALCLNCERKKQA